MKHCKFLALVLALVLTAALALPAAADSLFPLVQEQDDGLLTISYIYLDDDGNSHVLKYADFNLYCVADLDQENDLVNTSSFLDIDIPTNLFFDLDVLIETRNTLENFVDTNLLTPDYVVHTDGTGEVVVELPLGLYYIDAELYWDDDTSGETITAYYSTPFLVLIGAYDPDTGEYIYDYTAYPKISTLSLNNELLDVSVQKVWENTEHTTQPEEIRVSLYCDGECAGSGQTVMLNEENNWSYTWTGLSADATWSVSEESNYDDYTVTYETQIVDEQFLFIITNTFTGEPDPTPTPSSTATPPPPPPTEELPQTGSNLPYVPVFAGLGIVFLVMGILLKKAGDAPCE